MDQMYINCFGSTLTSMEGQVLYSSGSSNPFYLMSTRSISKASVSSGPGEEKESDRIRFWTLWLKLLEALGYQNSNLSLHGICKLLDGFGTSFLNKMTDWFRCIWINMGTALCSKMSMFRYVCAAPSQQAYVSDDHCQESIRVTILSEPRDVRTWRYQLSGHFKLCTLTPAVFSTLKNWFESNVSLYIDRQFKSLLQYCELCSTIKLSPAKENIEEISYSH